MQILRGSIDILARRPVYLKQVDRPFYFVYSDKCGGGVVRLIARLIRALVERPAR